MEQAYSISFHAKGVTLKELLTQYDFNKNLFRTFAGFFGSYAFGEEDWYYIIMGILYIALLIRIIIRFRGMKDRQKWWEFAAAAFVCCLQYVLIVYRAWFIDFQPQGRYLLPILFYITYLISRIDRLREDKMLRTILVCTCLLSLYCFIDVGIPNLVPDRVVLP
jgi:glucan phosphoethanolaminetransferase (alkaline phosphatase superfamily)